MVLAELIAELAKLNAAEVVDELHRNAHTVFQTIFDRGHATATKKGETDLATVKDQLTTAQQELERFRREQPDAAKLHEQYQGQIRDLKKTHETEILALRTMHKSERRDRAKSDLKAKLVARGVDPDYAEVLVSKPDTDKRIMIGEDGKLEVRQAGKDIPLVVADGADVLDLLAGELDKSTPPKFRVSNADTGTGIDGDRTKSGTGTKNVYDAVREKAKAAQAAQAGGGPGELEKRLGMTPAAS